MSVTKEIDRIAGEIAKDLEPKLFEMVSWGLDNTNLEVNGWSAVKTTAPVGFRILL